MWISLIGVDLVEGGLMTGSRVQVLGVGFRFDQIGFPDSEVRCQRLVPHHACAFQCACDCKLS